MRRQGVEGSRSILPVLAVWKGLQVRASARRNICEKGRRAEEMAAAAPSSAEVIHLFKALLREARKFPNYNVREYVKRRVKDGFKENRSATDPTVVAAAWENGRQSLQVAQRQSVVYSLYAPRTKSIMDIKITDVSS